jgi:hypothetical protein
VIGDIEWENVNLAAAFVLGALLGTLATIRVMRAVLSTFRNGRRSTPPSEGE